MCAVSALQTARGHGPVGSRPSAHEREEYTGRIYSNKNKTTIEPIKTKTTWPLLVAKSINKFANHTKYTIAGA